ncbi:MAG: hypothetical protein ACYDAC_08715 [Candidatus Dormibacteria bacterium]
MSTPPMLRTRPEDLGRDGPDPLVTLDVAAAALVSAGLLLAGILAVYDYSTPGAEAPLVLCVALIAVAALALNVAVVLVRHIRRARLGL